VTDEEDDDKPVDAADAAGRAFAQEFYGIRVGLPIGEHVAELIRAAEARGRAAGLEEAARLCHAERKRVNEAADDCHAAGDTAGRNANDYAAHALRAVAAAIRAAATGTPAPS
jgi:hypothetical protein